MSELSVGSVASGRVASIDALVVVDDGIMAADDVIITYVATEPGLYRLSAAGLKVVGAGTTAYIEWVYAVTGLFGYERIGKILSDLDPAVSKLELVSGGGSWTGFSGNALISVPAAPATIVFNVQATALEVEDYQFNNHMYIEKL